MTLPIRARLALLSATLVAALILSLGLFVYVRLEADLIDAVDEGLRSRAQTLLEQLANGPRPDERIPDDGDMFAQLLTEDGQVLAATDNLAPDPMIVTPGPSGSNAPWFAHAEVKTLEEPVPGRLLVVHAPAGVILVVGAPIEDQRDALTVLRFLLGLGGPVAIGLAGVVGWLIAGAALRPVERMRIAAEAISGSELGRRLPDPATRDELARLGTSLNSMLTRLEAAVVRERRFVDDASHEIRTPLANLKAELDLALRAPRSHDALVASLRSAAEETDRLARLAEDLLVLARADGGQLPVRREDLDLSALIHDTVDTFAGRAEALGVAFDESISDGLRGRVDGGRVRQAVSNLIDNALQHVPRGGRVVVSLTGSAGTIAIAVEDTGEGFPPAFLPRAFEAFTRADTARSRSAGGAGLGLSIVRAVAEAHGGSVTARNRPGGGATVELRLPA